jgi:predicted small lipoprotein YifL
MKLSGNTDKIIRLLLCLAALLILASCGKKGPPTMKSYAKPDVVKDVRIVHRDNRIDLSWSYSDKQSAVKIKGFRIFRAAGNAAYETVAELPADSTYYSDANIRINVLYSYKIRVFSARDVESEDLPELKVLPVDPPSPPTGVAYRVANDAIEIFWDGAPEGISFNIYRSAEKGVYPGQPLNEKPLDKPFFRDSLILKVPVFYTVIAVVQSNIPNESEMSAEIIADPKTYAPLPPADVRYIRSDTRGYISWKESEESWVSGYRVYRKGPDEDFKLLAEVQVPVYLDEDQVPDNTAYYVTATGPVKESQPSAVVRVKQ